MKNMALFNMFNADDETEKLANTLSWLDDEKEEEDDEYSIPLFDDEPDDVCEDDEVDEDEEFY